MKVGVRVFVFLAGFVLLQAGSSLLRGADIAVLKSDHTYAYFASTYQLSVCNTGDWNLGTFEYDRYFKGWEWVLNYGKNELNKNYDYDEIVDSDISPRKLQNYKVLILSNNYWLDDSQTKIIAEWVRRGGHLLATFGSGYRGADGDYLKGATNGLHELWGDPSNKVNSSYYIGNPAVDVQITQNGGPTKTFDAGQVLVYQYMANILIQRPEKSRDINAFFLFNGKPTHLPAIFNNRHSKGLVVYYAFAPEYQISLASDVAGHCVGDIRYLPQNQPSLDIIKDIATGLLPLMTSTLDYLLEP